ncbi:MAG: class I SAM-dependent methyltransferase [Myxococcales bacterium]|nr:class I SAM-dependent methyltransferase [Myxococcales bacterium]
MTSVAALLALVLVAAPACSKKSGDSGTGSGSGAGSGSAIVIPPYTPAADVPAPIRAAIAASDRADADRALDAGRKPGEVLAFYRVGPGQRIGELFAGGGYTTELMARVVGDGGTIYAQNTKEVLDRFARKPWTERAAKPVMKQVVAVEQPTDTPFPPEAKDLDLVITILNYHDFVWQKADTKKLNAAVFAALKPGGVYAIIDHSAAAGSGTRDCETLHRIDEETVKQEVSAAGFTLDASSDLLRNPADTRDWNSSPKAATEAGKRGTSDRFMLRFVKPLPAGAGSASGSGSGAGSASGSASGSGSASAQ